MFVTRLGDCREFLAGDHTVLRELLHPSKHRVRVNYSLAHGRLEPGARSKRHRLTSVEVYYFLAGSGVFWAGETSSPVAAGTLVCVPAGMEQWVENSGREPMEFLCLVEPAWKAEDEDVLE